VTAIASLPVREFDQPQGGLGPLRLLAGPRRGAPESWEEHCDRLGGPVTARMDHFGPRRLIAVVRRAGLTGRGGGGFPVADKLAAVLSHGPRRVVIANGSETEPAASKDNLLLTIRPHLVLDGLEVAAATIGAEAVALVVPGEAAGQSIAQALSERSARASGYPEVEVVLSSRDFVAGEETAVISWLEGGPARPRFQPPRAVERGWKGRPTLVHNVETLAHLGLIARFGADWFRTAGTAAEAGTMLVTMSGAFERPGVYEVPLGLPLGELFSAACPDRTSQTLLMGGYFGSWLELAGIGEVPLSRAGLAPLKASPGAGVIHLLPPGTCGVREAHRIADWLARQSAQQCGPCARGLPSLAGALGVVADPAADHLGVLPMLLRWCSQVEGRGACRHPDGVVNLIRSTIDTFSAELELHEAGRCSGPAASRLPLPAGRMAIG